MITIVMSYIHFAYSGDNTEFTLFLSYETLRVVSVISFPESTDNIVTIVIKCKMITEYQMPYLCHGVARNDL